MKNDDEGEGINWGRVMIMEASYTIGWRKLVRG